MTTLLITVHVASCIMLILVVLLQAGRGADMGAAFGGASTPMFGSGSAANPLTRITTIMAVMFLTTALFLAVASARRASVFDSTPEPLAVTPQSESSAPPAGIPAGEAAPAPIAEAQPLTIPAAPEAAAPSAAPADAPVAPAVPADAPSAEPAGNAAPAAPVEAPKAAAPAASAPAPKAEAPAASAPAAAPEAAPANP